MGLALGTMRLPALLLLGVSAPTAAGTNIIVSTSSALTGAIYHLRAGRVDINMAIVIGVPSMIGAFLGSFNGDRIPESILLIAIGLLVFWQGIEFLRPEILVGDTYQSGKLRLGTTRTVTVGGMTTGFALGLLGGAVGLILGSLRLPAMIRILGANPRSAAGTNLIIGFAMGSMGWIGHVTQGNVDYTLALLMGISGMCGSYLGAKLTGRVTMSRLTTTLGLILLIIGTILVWRGFI